MNMRMRHSTGGVRKQSGSWVGLWYEDGKKKSKVLGFVSEMTKGEAREAVGKIVAGMKGSNHGTPFDQFVEKVYFPFYSRKWKHSTRETNVNRIRAHLVKFFSFRDLSKFRRDDLQEYLDVKAKWQNLSYSIVAHLRWDLKQIFDLAVSEGIVERNPALLLFVPREAKKPVRRAMTIKEVRVCFEALEQRERLIAKLALLAGMRPGEIFALTWPRLTATYADIQQRVYRRQIDTPKTDNSIRRAALSEGLLVEMDLWRALAIDKDGWVFPSENMTPMSKDNCWRRNMLPKLEKIGLGWANFQVMRRTHSSLMKQLGVDPKLVADQLGHTLDVNQNVYTQSPVESRLVIVNQLEKSLLVQ
jgi:integrase